MQRSALPVPGPHGIAALYALLATLALLLLAPNMPPFQNADEPAHFLRADMISHGGFMAMRLPDGTVGGRVDAGATRAWGSFASLVFHPERKATRSMQISPPWGALAPATFQNTAIYPPFFYFPAALGIFLARNLGLSVLHGMLAARLATGLAAISIGAASIALARGAALWLFAILTIPMSMALTAALSQDAPMLACTALGVALCVRLLSGPPGHTAWWFAGACAALALAAMARPPYAAFAFVILALPVRPAWRWMGFAAIVICTLLWEAANLHVLAMPQFSQGSPDPYRQMLWLLHHPARLDPLLWKTWRVFHHVLFQGFIGYPGWQDMDLPDSFRKLALLILAVAAFVVLAGTSGKPSFAMLLAIAMTMLGTLAGIAAIQYLTWNLVGADMIDGIQGRYFLPPALLLGCALVRPVSALHRAAWLVWPVLLFPVLSIAVLMHALIMRYYFV